MAKMLTIELTKSLIGRKQDQIATAKSLGLKRPGDFTVQPDNDCTQGKIKKIGFMLKVTEGELKEAKAAYVGTVTVKPAAAPKKKATKKAAPKAEAAVEAPAAEEVKAEEVKTEEVKAEAPAKKPAAKKTAAKADGEAAPKKAPAKKPATKKTAAAETESK